MRFFILLHTQLNSPLVLHLSLPGEQLEETNIFLLSEDEMHRQKATWLQKSWNSRNLHNTSVLATIIARIEASEAPRGRTTSHSDLGSSEFEPQSRLTWAGTIIH